MILSRLLNFYVGIKCVVLRHLKIIYQYHQRFSTCLYMFLISFWSLIPSIFSSVLEAMKDLILFSIRYNCPELSCKSKVCKLYL